MILEGALSVKSALTYQRRVIHEVILPTKLSKDQGYIYHLAKKINVKVTQKDDVTSLVTGRTHGGVLAIVEAVPLDQIFPCEGLALIVEGVDDPFNLGMIMRTAAISGFKTIITNTKDFYEHEAIVVKSSAGTSEVLNWIRSSNIPSVIELYHKQNYKLVCAQRSDESKPFDEVNYPSQVILAIGGEKRGLSKEILRHSFMQVVIEYPSSQRVALSAVSAASILTYHLGRHCIRDII